jgi:hypothetical protein
VARRVIQDLLATSTTAAHVDHTMANLEVTAPYTNLFATLIRTPTQATVTSA